MSSVRIAAISGVLAAALGAGSWTAVSAFPLHGAMDLQSPVPRDPHAPPPRDPQTREAYQRQAAEYWELANNDLTLTPDEKIKTIFKGIEATARELDQVFARHGVSRIKSVGEPLDPHRHQAMVELPSDQEPGTIVEEMQPGYMMKDRLLRPALVGVAKKAD